MKTVTITGIMADFLDSIRAYEHESGKAIHFDERESSEFVNMYFNNGGKLKIEEGKPLFVTEDGVDVVNGMRIHSVRKSNFDRDSYIVDEDFVEEQTSKHPYVYFFHKSNADEYIWRNKPLLSVKDVVDNCENLSYAENIELIELAKERSEE